MHPLEPGAEYGIHLRATTPSGGKDWVGSIKNGVITTYWGKTGHINQHASKNGNFGSLQNIVIEKMAKGYIEVDNFNATSGWDSNQPPQGRYTGGDKPPLVLGPDITKTIKAPEAAIDYDF